jgi:hypothetical protein
MRNIATIAPIEQPAALHETVSARHELIEQLLQRLSAPKDRVSFPGRSAKIFLRLA